MRKYLMSVFGLLAVAFLVGADMKYNPGLQFNDLIQLKMVSESSLEIFSGSPDIFASDWDNSDLQSYRKVVGTAAADKGGVVYEFVIPQGATFLNEIQCIGKVGAVAAGNQINYRVNDEDDVEVATGTITAATETALTLTSFSPTPSLDEAERIVVEAEAVVDNTEEIFIGSCRATFSR